MVFQFIIMRTQTTSGVGIRLPEAGGVAIKGIQLGLGVSGGESSSINLIVTKSLVCHCLMHGITVYAGV